MKTGEPSYGGIERRRETRFPKDSGAFMRQVHPTVLERIEVHVLDESEGGLRFLTSSVVYAGAMVQIHLDHRFILGEVRYCKPTGKEFCVGIQFIDSVDDHAGR
jgi:hypothetical protein